MPGTRPGMTQDGVETHETWMAGTSAAMTLLIVKRKKRRIERCAAFYLLRLSIRVY
jgi:hypothetical protein